MKLVQVNMPEKMLEKIDAVVEKGYAGNRSDFIRIAVGEKLHRYNNVDRRGAGDRHTD